MKVAVKEHISLGSSNVMGAEQHDLFKVSALFPVEAKCLSSPFIIDHGEAVTVVIGYNHHIVATQITMNNALSVHFTYGEAELTKQVVAPMTTGFVFEVAFKGVKKGGAVEGFHNDEIIMGVLPCC